MTSQFQSDAERILAELIAHPSISAESNLPILQTIEEHLARFGMPSRRIPSSDGQKASLLATIGPADRPGIVLSGHTDVVPVEGQPWSTPPFEATNRDGRIYGRGASDMKGFLALALAHVPMFQRAALAMPVHLAFSYDEELGCRGAPDLVRAVADLPARPALCVVGEPTSLRVVRSHKGKISRRVTLAGRPGHSAMPHRAANAATAMARLAVRLDEVAEQLKRAQVSAAFDPPWTTLHIGSLHGGTALNLVPERATLEFELRLIPGADVPGIDALISECFARTQAELVDQAPEGGISVEELARYPALEAEQDVWPVTVVQGLAEDRSPAGVVSFGTEAGLYAQVGIPTVVCGPGDISRAHKADEWIGVSEIRDGCRFMERLCGLLQSPPSQWQA